MFDVTLWPPLDDVRRALGAAVDGGAVIGTLPSNLGGLLDSEAGALNADLPEALRTLVERRASMAALSNPDGWSSGDVVGLPGGGGSLLGVLLDEPEGGGDSTDGRVWRGWLTAAETDWAGAHDVLLEPGDEPFDPAVGVVQAWNRVRIRQTAAPLLGRLTAARIAAVRAVQDEVAVVVASGAGAIESRPGQIGLRAAGGFTVLTGTPLAAGDPRNDYRTLYRDVAQRLSLARPAEVTVPAPSVLAWMRHTWQRLLPRWMGDMPARLVVAGACAVVLGFTVQGWYFPPAPTAAKDDEIRFRSMPAPLPRAVLSVRWRDAADASDIATLLRGFGGELVGGPDAAGRWHVSVPDLAVAQRAMLASPLVAEVSSP